MSTLRKLVWVALGLLLLVRVGSTHRDGAPASEPAPVTADVSQPQVTNPSPSLEETATHEAGHVTALREFKIPVWYVTADAEGGGETVSPFPYFHDPKLDAYDYAVVDAAGQEAEVVWLEEHRGCTRATALVVSGYAAGPDMEHLRADAAVAGITEGQARDRARQIVLAHQQDINATARQIIAAGGYLTSDGN
ncbi:MAG: hypothetical protein ACREQ5_00885 [Candidatus Dormibacteria bacterium]